MKKHPLLKMFRRQGTLGHTVNSCAKKEQEEEEEEEEEEERERKKEEFQGTKKVPYKNEW